MLAFGSGLDVWNGLFGQVGAQRAGAGSHAKIETNETGEMDAGQVAECKMATVSVVGRRWALVANWILENRYNLVLNAGVDTMTNSMSSRVAVHSVVRDDAATEVAGAAEDGARVRSLGLKQYQAQCTHSEKVRCCRDTHRQNGNRQTRTADQYYWEHSEVQGDHAFVRLAHRMLAQQTFRKRGTHASPLRHTEYPFLYYCHGILARGGNQCASRVRVKDALGPLSDSRREKGDPEHTRRLRVPKALERVTESRHILYPEYMRSYVALEGKAELARTGFAAGRAQGVVLGHKMFQVAKSLPDGNIRDACRAESMTESALRRQLRTGAQMWAQGGENTFHDENLCAHQQV